MNMFFILFYIFFKIGLFTFGGGYAMIPMMQQEMIEVYHWMSQQEFIDVIAISGITPGVAAVNIATFLGYKVSGQIMGGIMATLGVILPSSGIVLVLTHYFGKFKHSDIIQRLLKFIRPAIPGIIASAAFILSKDALNDIYGFIIFISAFYLSAIKKLNPILIILAASIAGIIIY